MGSSASGSDDTVRGTSLPPNSGPFRINSSSRLRWVGYLLATAVVAACTAVDWAVESAVSESDLVMVYLVGVLVVARLFPLGPALWSAALSVAAFDILFVEPRFTLAVDESRYLISFAVMAATAVVLASTTARIRSEAERARERARRLQFLYDFSRDLALADDDADLARITRERVECSLGLCARIIGTGESAQFTQQADTSVAQFRLEDVTEQFGLLQVRTTNGSSFDPSVRETLEAFARQLSVAQARARSAAERRCVRVEVERERLRSSLLSSVSHDLRTPLGSIIGAASTLVASPGLGDADRNALALAIHEEATSLGRWLENLLEMTRIEGGALQVEKSLEVPEELVGAVLARVANRAQRHRIRVAIAEDPALVPLDPVRMEVVMVNLVENALAYTPPGSTIDIRAHRVGTQYRFIVEDNGPGVPPDERERIFQKFYRCEHTEPAGSGLGLAICRAIVEAQGGSVRATAPDTGRGLRVVVDLPWDSSHLDEGDAA